MQGNRSTNFLVPNFGAPNFLQSTHTNFLLLTTIFYSSSSFSAFFLELRKIEKKMWFKQMQFA